MNSEGSIDQLTLLPLSFRSLRAVKTVQDSIRILEGAAVSGPRKLTMMHKTRAGSSQ